MKERKSLQQIFTGMSEAREKAERALAACEAAKSDQERKAADAAYDAAMSEFDMLDKEGKVRLAERRTEQVQDGGLPTATGGDTFNGLTERVSIRTYLKAALAGKPITEGAEHELNTERSLGDGIGAKGETRVPFDALEVRADANTSAPSSGDPASQRGVVGRVFARGVTSYLGTQIDSVPSGQANYMVLTAGVSPQMRTRAQKKESEAASLTGVELQPRRLAASYRISVEDVHRVGANFEAAIRRDLSAALMAEMDDRVINNSSNPQGFLAALTDLTDMGAKATFTTAIEMIAGALDGIYAANLAEVRTVVGTSTGTLLATLLRSGNAADQTAYEWINRVTGGLRISDYIPGASSTIQEGLQYRSGGTGGPDAVAAVWDSFSLITDPYSNSQSGLIGLTANMLWDFRVLRSGAYRQPNFKVA